MRPTDNVNRLVRKLQLEASSELDKRVHEDIDNALAASKKIDPARPGPTIGRTIMKSRITRLAAAAVVIVAVGLAITIGHKFIPTAYAVGQTIEAMKDITIMRLCARDAQDNNVELWAQINPDTGLMTNFHLDEIDRGTVTVSTPRMTYSYNRNANLAEIKDGPGLEAPFRIGRFIEDMTELANRMGGRIEHHKAYDSTLGKDVIILEITSSRADLRAVIDPATKLPIRFDSARGLNLGQPFELKDIDIHYASALPEGIFEYAVPAGATVVKHTVDRKDQFLSSQIIRYASEVYARSAEKSGGWCNTRMTVVDADMNVSGGGVLGWTNNSGKVWEDEISLCNTDSMEIAVFNEKGEKLEARLVQRKPLSPGRFRKFIKPNEPVEPGESRSFVYWDGHAEPCRRTDIDNSYTLRMQNFPGEHCLETFILVLAPNIEINKTTQDHTSYEQIDGHGVYVWQEYIPAGQDHQVTVELTKLD